MSEFRYNYVEFVDHISRNSMLSRKDGELAFVGEPDEDLIREFQLEKDSNGYYRTSFSIFPYVDHTEATSASPDFFM